MPSYETLDSMIHQQTHVRRRDTLMGMASCVGTYTAAFGTAALGVFNGARALNYITGMAHNGYNFDDALSTGANILVVAGTIAVLYAVQWDKQKRQEIEQRPLLELKRKLADHPLREQISAYILAHQDRWGISSSICERAGLFFRAPPQYAPFIEYMCKQPYKFGTESDIKKFLELAKGYEEMGRLDLLGQQIGAHIPAPTTNRLHKYLISPGDAHS